MKFCKIILMVIINLIFVANCIILVDWFLCTQNFYIPIYPMFPDYNNGRIENDIPYDKNKGTIVTIGDSFTFGYFIDQEDTFSYKLQQKTMRKTYNRGFSGTGIQHVLYQLQHSSFFDNINPEPEYIIYTFIGDHVRRIYVNYMSSISNQKNLRYIDKNGKLELIDLDINTYDMILVSLLGKKTEDILFKLKSNNEKFDFF